MAAFLQEALVVVGSLVATGAGLIALRHEPDPSITARDDGLEIDGDFVPWPRTGKPERTADGAVRMPIHTGRSPRWVTLRGTPAELAAIARIRNARREEITRVSRRVGPPPNR